MHACMYVCMYVCYVCLLCVHGMGVCMHVCNLCTYVRMYAYYIVYICTYACTVVGMHVCIHVYAPKPNVDRMLPLADLLERLFVYDKARYTKKV